MADYDAIIVGAGHNGLVCALYLMRAGWRVAVLEATDEIGGGVRSGEVTLPGFCHDRYATNFGAFAASPVYRDLQPDFDSRGVKFLHSERPYAALDAHRPLRIYTDGERTQAEFAALGNAEVEGWQQLKAFYQRVAPNLFPLFYTELPSVSMWPRAADLLRGGVGDAVRLGRLLFQSSGEFAATFFKSAAARGLLEAWGYHLDFAPDIAGGAVFAFVAALSSHFNGMPLVEGGAGRITVVLGAMLESGGAKVITKADVSQIIVRSGAAVAVRTRDGEEHHRRPRHHRQYHAAESVRQVAARRGSRSAVPDPRAELSLRAGDFHHASRARARPRLEGR